MSALTNQVTYLNGDSAQYAELLSLAMIKNWYCNIFLSFALSLLKYAIYLYVTKFAKTCHIHTQWQGHTHTMAKNGFSL